MPCYSDGNQRLHIENQIEKNEIREEGRKHYDYSLKMEAIICAVMNELDCRGIAEEVAVKSSRHGRVDVVGWWDFHKKNDKSRIIKALHSFSVDEQRIMFDSLKPLFIKEGE